MKNIQLEGIQQLKEEMSKVMPGALLNASVSVEYYGITAKVNVSPANSAEVKLIKTKIEIDNIELGIFIDAIQEDRTLLAKQFASYLSQQIGVMVANAMTEGVE